jgi:thiamine biosynthesis lipoprotein
MRRPSTPCLVLALVLAAGAAHAGEDVTARFSLRTMGTTATLTLAGPDSSALAPLASRALRNFERVDSLMSNWTATSEVARLNRALADAAPYEALAAEHETGRVLGAALHIAAASGGAFDPTVEPLVRLWGFLGGRPTRPDSTDIHAVLSRVGHRALVWNAARRALQPAHAGLQIDLGGIAKGYAVDCVRDSLTRMGVTDALVDLSGNIAQLGSPPGREHWRLGLRDPAHRDATLGTLTLTRSAVATSGDYEQFFAADGRRYGHILDPRTGWPADSLASSPWS